MGELLVELLTDDCKVSNVGYIQIRRGFFPWTGLPTWDDSRIVCSGLHLATYSNFAGLVRYLLEAGCFVADVKDAFGRTPLMWAAFEGHEATVKALIHHQDADVNLLVYDGTGYLTALGYAAISGHAGIVELLLERDDIDVNLVGNPKSFTPLIYAAAMGNEAVVKVLLKHTDLAGDYQVLQRSIAQFLARDMDLGKRIASRGVRFQTPHVEDFGRPPMGEVAFTGRQEVARLLMECGQYGMEGAYARTQALGGPTAARRAAVIRLLESFSRTRSSIG